MAEQYFIVKIDMVRKSSPEVLTLPRVLKLGVTKYQFFHRKGSRPRPLSNTVRTPTARDCLGNNISM